MRRRVWFLLLLAVAVVVALTVLQSRHRAGHTTHAHGIRWSPVAWRQPMPRDDAFVVDESADGHWILSKLGDYPNRDLMLIDARTWTAGPRVSGMRESARFLANGDVAMLRNDREPPDDDDTRSDDAAPEIQLVIASPPSLVMRRAIPIRSRIVNPQALAVSHDATRIALLGSGLEVWRIDVAPAVMEFSRPIPSGPNMGITFLGDTHDVAAFTSVDPMNPSDVRGWSSRLPSADLVPIRTANGDAIRSEGVDSMQYTADGSTLLSIGRLSNRSVLATFDAATFRPRTVTVVGGARTSNLTHSSDGRVAAWLEATTFRIWDLQAEREIATYRMTSEESNWVSWIHVSPDGRRLLFTGRWLSSWATASVPTR